MKFYMVYDQELVWSVAFFVGVWWCLGHLLAFVKCSVVFAAVIWSWEPWGWHCPAVFLVSKCVVVPYTCSVFVALLAWRCGLNYSSLVVLGVPSLSHPLFSIFFSAEPSGLSVMGACRGSGVGGSWLGCGLGRPVRCSSTSGMWLRLQTLGFVGAFPLLATWALTRSIKGKSTVLSHNRCYGLQPLITDLTKHMNCKSFMPVFFGRNPCMKFVLQRVMIGKMGMIYFLTNNSTWQEIGGWPVLAAAL